MSLTASIAPEQSETVRILHVDDEPDQADLTATSLTREDERFAVKTAANADDGLELLARHEFDCIISDYDMPGKTGIEFLEAVRENDDDLPFILYTGKGSEEVASDAISVGVTDYLQKQPGSDQYRLLANRVANAVEQYRARQAMENTRRRFRSLVEEATDAILIVDPDGTLVYATPSAETILGRPPEELVGTNGFDPIHPDDREHVMAEFASLVDNPDERRTVEFRYQQPDGSYIWAEARGRDLLDESLINGVVVYARDITDRKERELELQRQERRYQAVFNDPNILVGLIDTDGTVRDINQTAMEYIGATLDELTGKPFWETPWFNHSEAIVKEVKGWIERAAAGEYVEFEVDLVRSDGEPYTVEGVFRPVTNEEGEVVSLLISDRDITEQKQREKELETVRRRFEAVLENTTTPMFMKDDEGEYIFVNKGYRELFGLEDAEIVGHTDVDLHPPEMAAQVRKNDRAVVDRGEALETVEPIIVNGNERVFLSTKVPIYDTGDRSDPEDPVAIFGVATDITERMEQQQVLENREQILRRVYEIIADKDRSVSEKIDALLTVGRKHIGTTYATFSRIDNDQYEFEAIATASEIDLEAGETTALSEFPICERVFQSGQPLVFNDVTAEAPELVDPTWGIACYLGAPVVVNGEKVGTFCFFDVEPRAEDFSDWEQTFVEILSDWVGSALTRQQAHDRVARRNKRLDEFADIVSHDLGNPLNVAAGRLELARETGEREHFDMAERALDRLDALIEDLANVMREGQLTNELTDVDLETVAQSCWKTLHTKRATVEFDDTRLIRADENALTRLLDNLLRNAVDHGGADVTVRIGALQHGFYVEDDGVGISEDERDDIFEPGFSTKRDGTGFGMVSVKQIALAHGWDVTVTESSDGGARFEFTDI